MSRSSRSFHRWVRSARDSTPPRTWTSLLSRTWVILASSQAGCSTTLRLSTGSSGKYTMSPRSCIAEASARWASGSSTPCAAMTCHMRVALTASPSSSRMARAAWAQDAGHLTLMSGSRAACSRIASRTASVPFPVAASARRDTTTFG